MPHKGTTMLRNIPSVITGYATMFIVIFVSFTIAYLAMGEDGAFKEGSYEVSTLWIAVSLVLGTVAAILGGIVCALVSQHSRGAVLSLIVLVLVLGGVTAWMETQKPEITEETAARSTETSNSEAMMNARQPMFMLIANPIIGAIGVLIGSALAAPCCKKRV